MEKIDLIENVLYFTRKRDEELNRFNELIKCGETDERRTTDCFNSLMRKQKQLKLIEDALIIFHVTSKIK